MSTPADREQLLDELARVYAMAAVRAYLVEQQEQRLDDEDEEPEPQ
jgi:hypothetical protein